MASIRLKFPEKNEPTVIVLSGARVTLGRLPLNTIQVIDRTLSGFHAEFVLEDDHYRLHDRGSTNGTFVNGDAVTDFHLREACKISFGSLECDFSPEATAPAESANVEALPTRSEINAVRQENAELKNRVASLREELDALQKAAAAEPGSSAATVDKAAFEKVVAEREALKEAQHTHEQEIAKLKTDLAVLQRDRENLKKVAENAKAEFASFRTEPPPAAPAPATPPPLKAPELPVAGESPEPANAAPPSIPAPVPKPKPSFALPAAAKAAPKPPGGLPAGPAKLPVAAPAPAPSTAPAKPEAPASTPAPTVRPIAAPKPIAAPAAGGTPPLKPLPKPVLPVKKGGTQKIDIDAAQPAKPASPGPMKPPVKLPLQPTVKLQPGTPLPRPSVINPKKDATDQK